MKTLVDVEPRVAVQSLPTVGEMFVISEPGSYYLTGDIAVSYGVAISVESANVVLDLNGFALLGNESCDSAINLSGFNNTVRNGTIRGWPLASIWGANCVGCVVEDILSEDSGSRTREDAISLAQNGRVRRVTVRNNPQGPGIRVLGGSVIESCIVDGAWDGFQMLSGGNRMTHCTSRNNNGAGVYSEGLDLIESSVFEFNAFDGIQVLGGAVLRGNVLRNNAAGFYVLGNNNRIEDNLVLYNGEGVVLELGSTGNTVERNQVLCRGGGNGIRAVDPGNLIDRNMVGDCGNDYDIGPGNTVGEIVDFTSGGEINACGPWADFRY